MLPSTQEAEAKKTTDTPSAQVHQSATDDHTYTLPTKAEAINEGGKPAYQFKKIRETNYGKLLDTIDKYHALNESDRDARTRKLLEMQSLIVRWLENPDRQNNNEGDRAKASFLGRIRPIIKVLYYKTKTNREVFDPINSDAATNAELNKQLIQAELENKHLISDHEFINSLLNKVKQAPLTTNFRAETLNSFLKGGTDWQNAFQTMYKDQSPGGDLGTEELGGAKQREDAERYLGYSPFTEEQRENRPAYTAVNVLNNPKGASSGYGKCYFVWKEHVKKRATYTAFDSLEMRSNQKNKGVKREESIGTHEHIGATLAQNKDVLLALTKMVQGQELSSKELNSRYIEAAIHGGLSLDDVAELVVAFPKNESPEIWGQEYVDKFNQKYPNIKITYKPT
ncbi:MAG: DUF3626 domain-containing protein [Nostoc sp.]